MENITKQTQYKNEDSIKASQKLEPVNLEPISEAYEFRAVRSDEGAQTAEIEAICFPPNEACTLEQMSSRVEAFPEMLLCAIDKKTGLIAGFLSGLATDEDKFRDDFFKDVTTHNPCGKNIMLLGLNVRPEHRMKGLARAIVEEYKKRSKDDGRVALYLTCHDRLISMYESMGFEDLGMSASVWGGEVWHEMVCKLR